jgi:hypothetical protein
VADDDIGKVNRVNRVNRVASQIEVERLRHAGGNAARNDEDMEPKETRVQDERHCNTLTYCNDIFTFYSLAGS